jgi:hypothetical protein
MKRFGVGFLLVLAVGCGEVAETAQQTVTGSCVEIPAMERCEPASIPGVCIGQGGPDEVLFRPCDRFLADGCRVQYLGSAFNAPPERITTCRSCLDAYYPKDYVEGVCTRFDLED